MTDLDLDALRAAAEAALPKGLENTTFEAINYKRAFQPRTILALLDRLAQAEMLVAELEEDRYATIMGWNDRW